MTPNRTHVSAAFNCSHDTTRVFARDPLQSLRNGVAHATHAPTVTEHPLYTKITPAFTYPGTTHDPPPLPRAPSARPRNPLIRFRFTLRSLSQFQPLPHPTSHPPLSILPLKPVLIFMKSHAAPNFRVKPLFYPEGTPTPLTTLQTPKHSRDPFPPSTRPSRPHTPSNR